MKSVITSLLALIIGLYVQIRGSETALDLLRPIDKDSYWSSHREEVKGSFVISWDAYTKYAWGTFFRDMCFCKCSQQYPAS